MITRTRLGSVAAYLAAALLIFAAVGWFFNTLETSDLFGISLTEATSAYGIIKGVEDLVAALILIGLLTTHQLRAAGIALLVALLIPLSDSWLVFQHAGAVAALWIHLPYALVMGFAAFALLSSPKE